MIEKNYTPTGDTDGDGIDDDFKNNEDDVNIAVTSCLVDGYIYLDINNNNRYDTGSDLPMGNFPVTITQNGTIYTVQTNGNGYYRSPVLSCRHNSTVSYMNPSNYLPDSAQYQYSDQKTPVTTFVVPFSSFSDGYKNPDVSEDNNFGLVGYGLSIVKYFSGNSAMINGTETFFPMMEALVSG